MNELDTSKPIKMYHIINAICNIKSNSFQNPLTSPFSRKTKNNFSIKYDKMAKIWQLRHIENRIAKKTYKCSKRDDEDDELHEVPTTLPHRDEALFTD